MIKGVRALINKVCKQIDISPNYIYGIIMALNDGDYAHVYYRYDNYKKDYYVGIMQVSYIRAQEIIKKYKALFVKNGLYKKDLQVIDLFDPMLNIFIGSLIIKDLYIKHKNWAKIIFVYYTEIENVDDALIKKDLFTSRVLALSKRWFAN